MKKAGDQERVVVIGGGLGGLAAACTLAARGYAVTLCERNAWVGGKAAVLAEQGFRFDMGPTILTIPRVLKRIYAEAGRDLESALDLVPLDEGDDPHRRTALGAAKRIRLVHLFDERGPAPSGFPRRGRAGRFPGPHGGRWLPLGSSPPRLVGVPPIVPDQVLRPPP